MNYARQRGYGEVVDKLAVLANKYGTRFTPHDGWNQAARGGRDLVGTSTGARMLDSGADSDSVPGTLARR